MNIDKAIDLSSATPADTGNIGFEPPSKSRGWRRFVAPIVFLGALLLPAFVVPLLRLGMATDVVTYAVAVLGLNLFVGFTGQISLGHSAFLGIGAYTTVILSGDHHWPLVATVPVAALVAFGAGVIIGVPALRIRGLYLALLTLGVGAAFGPIVKRFDHLTGGTSGKSSRASIVAPTWFGDSRIANARWSYLTIAAVAALVFAAARNMVDGRIGRALAAIRENDLSAITFGVSVRQYKVAMFGISAAVTAVAGSMFMIQHPYAIDSNYTQQLSIVLYTAVFIGGVGTIWGSIVGGAVIVAVPFLFEKLGYTLDPNLVYGVALVGLTLFAPDGVAGSLRRAGRKLRSNHRGAR